MRQNLLYANTLVANTKMVRLDAPRISMQNNSLKGFSNPSPKYSTLTQTVLSLSLDPFLSQYRDALYTLLATVLNRTRVISKSATGRLRGTASAHFPRLFMLTDSGHPHTQ